jgi:hypothetical protein
LGVVAPQIIKPTTTTDYDNNDNDDDTAQSSLTEVWAPPQNYNITSQSSVNESLAVISVCIPGDRFNTEYIDASLSNKQHFCETSGGQNASFRGNGCTPKRTQFIARSGRSFSRS